MGLHSRHGFSKKAGTHFRPFWLAPDDDSLRHIRHIRMNQAPEVTAKRLPARHCEFLGIYPFLKRLHEPPTKYRNNPVHGVVKQRASGYKAEQGQRL